MHHAHLGAQQQRCASAHSIWTPYLAFASQLTGISFCKQGKSLADLTALINTARTPTAQRVSTLEVEVETLRAQLAGAGGPRGKPARAGGAPAEAGQGVDARAEAAAKQREQEELVSAPNPINEYVEMLEEKVWCTPALPMVCGTMGPLLCVF